MRISAAIGPTLRALAETAPLDMLRDAILASLPKIGEPVIEPALRAYAEADDRAFRVSVGSILARIGVLDDRIFAVLLEMLEISPSRAGDLAQYGTTELCRTCRARSTHIPCATATPHSRITDRVRAKRGHGPWKRR